MAVRIGHDRRDVSAGGLILGECAIEAGLGLGDELVGDVGWRHDVISLGISVREP
jgi:hypothetical protein